MGVVGQGQRDGPGADPNVRKPRSGRRKVHASAGRGCVGTCVLSAIPEPQGRVLQCDLGCDQLEDGGEEIEVKQE